MQLGFAVTFSAIALCVLTAKTSSSYAFPIPVVFARASTSSAIGMVGAWDNDNFLANLSGRNKGQAEEAVDLSKLTTEEQAALFRQFVANPQPPAASEETYGPPLPKTLRGGSTDDITGRKTGRNRDADSIANTSDLYFAQLKRDSSIRQKAFFYGDEEVAEAVFADPSVQELPSQLTVNPFLDREDTAEELALMDMVDEELAVIRVSLKATPPVDVTTAGVNYKEKLLAKTKVKTGSTPDVPGVVLPPPIVPGAISAPVVQRLPELVVPLLQQRMPVPTTASIVQQIATQPLVVAASQAVRTVEECHQDIRTLQGLLLKHRGGSGFGSGILRGDEVNTYKTTLKDIIYCLRGEVDAVTVRTAPPPVVVVAAPVAVTAGATSTMGTALACVEGAAIMYKNSPVEMQTIMVPTLRAAFVAAVLTCTTVIGDGGASIMAPPLNPADAATRMMPTLACVQGAVQMYKYSSPELQPVIVKTVREALLAAVTTCDQLLGGISHGPFSAALVVVPSPADVQVETEFDVVPEQVVQLEPAGETWGSKNESPSDLSTLGDQPQKKVFKPSRAAVNGPSAAVAAETPRGALPSYLNQLSSPEQKISPSSINRKTLPPKAQKSSLVVSTKKVQPQVTKKGSIGSYLDSLEVTAFSRSLQPTSGVVVEEQLVMVTEERSILSPVAAAQVTSPLINGTDTERQAELEPWDVIIEPDSMEEAALKAKYAAIEDLGERCYTILVDLGYAGKEEYEGGREDEYDEEDKQWLSQ